MLKKEIFHLKKTFSMEQNLDNKIDFKSRTISFYKENKIKIQIFLLIILISFFSIIFLQVYNDKQNNLISEQFIEAGIIYNKNEKNSAKKLYEDILRSKNSFYSTLALNEIIEKNLEKDDKKILEYFDTVESLQKNKEQKDILKFKKALFLLQDHRKFDLSHVKALKAKKYVEKITV